MMRWRIFGWLLMVLCFPAVDAATIEIGPNGCSLADAIRSANNDNAVGLCASGSGTDTIIAPDGWTIPISSQLPTITSDMTITTESSAGVLTIDGQRTTSIMRVTGSGTDLNLIRVAFEDGQKTSGIGGGGAALNISNATVSIADSTFYFNSVRDAKGGAIKITDGTLTVLRTWFSTNFTEVIKIPFVSQGGAIAAENSHLQLTEVWFEDNTAIDDGASIYLQGGSLELRQSLIFEHVEGVFAKNADVIITNSTFSAHTNASENNLLKAEDSTINLNHVTLAAGMVLRDTTIAASNSVLGKCTLIDSAFSLDTHNLYWNDRCLGVGVDTELLPLTDNGGFTLTRAAKSISPVLNAGDPVYCLAEDQRGETRDIACDIGAFEALGFADVQAELQLEQAEPFVSGQSVSGLMTIQNLGAGVATAVEVDLDTADLFVTNIYSGWCPSLPCTLNQLDAGDSVEITFDAILNDYTQSPFVGELSALSTEASTHMDVNEGTLASNNVDVYSATIHPGADLTLDLSPTTQPPYALSQTMKYQASITNHGPQNANDVELIVVPDNLVNISFDDCDSVMGETCTIHQIPVGFTKQLVVSGEIDASEFDITGLVGATEVDIADADNSDSTGNQGAISDTDVSVSMSLTQAAPFYSFSYMEFDVSVETGAEAATNIQISSDMPGALYIQFCGSGECFVPSMSAHDQYDMTISMLAPVSAHGLNPDIWEHTVYVQPAQTDTNTANNTVVMSGDLFPTADVALDVQLLTDPPFYVGQLIAYEIVIVNGGSNHASQVALSTDSDNLNLESVSGSLCNALNCTITQLDFAQRETIVVEYVIEQAGPFNFGASVSADDHDTNPANNQDLDNAGTATLAPLESIYENGFEDL